jgi:hypothetical protein
MREATTRVPLPFQKVLPAQQSKAATACAFASALWHAGQECGGVCSEDASDAFIPGRPTSVIRAMRFRKAARNWSR